MSRAVDRDELGVSVAMRLRQAREERGWTQSDLGDRCGMSVATVSHYEVGYRCPSLLSAVRLADALSVSLDWLTERDQFREGFPD